MFRRWQQTSIAAALTAVLMTMESTWPVVFPSSADSTASRRVCGVHVVRFDGEAPLEARNVFIVFLVAFLSSPIDRSRWRYTSVDITFACCGWSLNMEAI